MHAHTQPRFLLETFPEIRLKAVHAWKVKRVALAMALRKNAKATQRGASEPFGDTVREVCLTPYSNKKNKEVSLSDLTVLVAASLKL